MASPGSAGPRTLVFAYSEVGARCLELLLARGVPVVALYTHRDDPAETRWFRCAAELAERAGVPVEYGERLRNPAQQAALRALRPELILSFYYRRLIPVEVLRLARLGAFNLHGSLLPAYRGRAPVNWAILHGETRTGATLHHMVERADAGDIVDQEPIPIGPEDTAQDVSLRLADAACAVLARSLPALLAGTAPRTPQDESRASCFGRRRPEDGRIDWTQSAARIADLVRAVTRPFPGAFTDAGERRLYVWRARPLGSAAAARPGQVLSQAPLAVAAGDGALELLEWSWCGGESPCAPPAAGSTLGR